MAFAHVPYLFDYCREAISAPFGANTAVLRQALEEKGILWKDQTSVTAGSSWLDVLDRELSRSDFVCAILPAEREGNIFFELGIAYAKGKPILALVVFQKRIWRPIGL